MELETPGPRPLPTPAHWGLLALREYLSLVLSRVSRLLSLVAEMQKSTLCHISACQSWFRSPPPFFFLIVDFLA